MSQQKAELFPRFLAALIDGVVASVFSVVPVVGGLVGSLYLLCKDGVMYQLTKQDDWRNRSIGKKLLNLQVTRIDGGDVDMAVSAKRNAPLALGGLIAVVPVAGWVVGSIVGFTFGVLEALLVLTDAEGRRLGDRWANTQVTPAEPGSTVA